MHSLSRARALKRRSRLASSFKTSIAVIALLLWKLYTGCTQLSTQRRDMLFLQYPAYVPFDVFDRNGDPFSGIFHDQFAGNPDTGIKYPSYDAFGWCGLCLIS